MKDRRFSTRLTVFGGAFFTLVVGAMAIAQAPAPAAPAAASPTAPATPATEPAKPAEVVYKDGVIKVGTEFKKSIGVVTDVDKGDNGCYLTLKDDKGVEFIEVGKVESHP